MNGEFRMLSLPPNLTRRRVLAAAPAVAGIVFAACGGQREPAATQQGSNQPVKVVLSTDWNSTTRMAVIEQMKSEFMRTHPIVTVEVDYFTSATSTGGSAGTYSEKVIAA